MDTKEFAAKEKLEIVLAHSPRAFLEGFVVIPANFSKTACRSWGLFDTIVTTGRFIFYLTTINRNTK